ncbi:MAG: Asp/Glu racemase [Subtercola sp.]|jgi:uncharacterized glyoxalase superfamily protein PhnB|nr:Asp/Glu racemase [Subtercola sp.]
MTNEPLIALISATPTAIPAATAAILERIPTARVWNIVDDRLLSDAQMAGTVTPQLEERMQRLIAHALLEKPDSVLLTCSQYGAVARRTTATIPVLPPDDAAFEQVIAGGYRTVLVLASLESARDDTVRRLTETLAAAGVSADIESRVVANAAEYAALGNTTALLDVLASAAAGDHDAVLLAQYSLSTVAGELASATGKRVISGPTAAAESIDATLRRAP